MSKSRTHSPEFKARVAMGAISGRKTIQELLANSDVKTTMIYIHVLNQGTFSVRSPAEVL